MVDPPSSSVIEIGSYSSSFVEMVDLTQDVTIGGHTHLECHKVLLLLRYWQCIERLHDWWHINMDNICTMGMGVVAGATRSGGKDMKDMRAPHWGGRCVGGAPWGWGGVQWGLNISQTKAFEYHCTITVRISNALQKIRATQNPGQETLKVCWIAQSLALVILR